MLNREISKSGFIAVVLAITLVVTVLFAWVWGENQKTAAETGASAANGRLMEQKVDDYLAR